MAVYLKWLTIVRYLLGMTLVTGINANALKLAIQSTLPCIYVCPLSQMNTEFGLRGIPVLRTDLRWLCLFGIMVCNIVE